MKHFISSILFGLAFISTTKAQETFLVDSKEFSGNIKDLPFQEEIAPFSRISTTTVDSFPFPLGYQNLGTSLMYACVYADLGKYQEGSNFPRYYMSMRQSLFHHEPWNIDNTRTRLYTDTVNKTVTVSVLGAELQKFPGETRDYAFRMYQNGVVEFLFGDNNLSASNTWNRDDLELNVYIGTEEGDTAEFYDLLIAGDPLAPTLITGTQSGYADNYTEQELSLDYIPAAGTMYTVTPNFGSTGIIDREAILAVTYWDAQENLVVRLAENTRQHLINTAEIINLSGQKVWTSGQIQPTSSIKLPAKAWKSQGIVLVTLENGRQISRRF